MGSPLIGSARVAIVPVLDDGFGAALKAKLAGQLAAIGRPDIPVSLSVDDASLIGLDAKMKALGGVSVSVGVNLDTAALGAALTAAQGVLDAHPLQVRVQPDFTGAGAARAAMGAAGAAAGAAAGGKGGGGAAGLAATTFDLFGGATPGIPALLTSVSGLHLAIDGTAEGLAVVVPAVVALGVYSAVAAADVKAIYTNLSNANVVLNATGRGLYPVTGGFMRLQGAANPSVMTLYGEALSVVGTKSGALTSIVTETGSALDQLGARAALALRSSSGMSFMAGFEQDITGLGTVVGNTLGVIGGLLHAVPGYAKYFLDFADTATGALESIANSGVTQGLLKVALGVHGVYLYAGLAAAVLSRGLSAGLTGISNIALNSAVRLDGMGTAGAAASESLLGVGAAAEAGAALPLGWILAAAAGLGALAYEAFSAQSAAESLVSGLQSSLSNLSAGGAGVLAISRDSIILGKDLSAAQAHLAALQKAGPGPNANDRYGSQMYANAVSLATNQTDAFRAGLVQLQGQSILYSDRLNILAKQFGGTAQAQGLLTASGVTMSQMLSSNKTTWAEVEQAVLGASLAYRAMGQTGGILGSDLFVLNQQASEQVTDMQKLNSAWAAFLAMSTSVQTGELGVIQAMRTLTTDAHAAGASFTGVNAASITLQQAFSGQVTSLGTLEGSLRSAGAPAKVLADILSTDLLPQLKAGALGNSGFRQQLYDLAVQAGYTGRDAIAPLNAWFDKNAGSIGRALRLADRYAAAIGKIPASATKALTFDLQITGSPVASMLLNQTLTNASKSGTGTITLPGHAAGTLNASAGWATVGEAGPELINLRGGEQILPNSSIAGLASALSGYAGQRFAGTSGGGGMTVNNTFNGFGTQQLIGVVRQAITAASVQQGQRLRIGRPA